MSVGTNADRTTTVTSSVYCVVLIRWWVRPNSAEIEPTVSPVAMSRIGAGPERRGMDERPRMQEKERSEQRESDRTQPVHEYAVVHEDPGHNEPGHPGRQNGFAAGLGGQAAEREEHQKQQLDLRFGDAVPDPRAPCPGP
jgi:hypothetical protein